MNLPEFRIDNHHTNKRVIGETHRGNHKRKIPAGPETTDFPSPTLPLTQRQKRLLTCWLAVNMPERGCDENLQNAVEIMQNQLRIEAPEPPPTTNGVTRIKITGQRTSPSLVFEP